MDLSLTKRKTSVRIEKRDGGKLIARYESRFSSDKAFSEASRILSVPKTRLMELVDTLQNSETESLQIQMDLQTPFTVWVRGRLQPGDESLAFTGDNPLAAFRAALDAQLTLSEPLIYWNGTDELCALDLDFHEVPYEARLEHTGILGYILPKPAISWVTHGRGCRGVYPRVGGLSGAELAALGGLFAGCRNTVFRVELKSGTRHPRYALPDNRTCGPINVGTSSVETGSLAAIMGSREVEPEQVAEWLQERGLLVGGRYPHTACPLRPQEDANRDPVAVREDGIFCHACAGRGVTYGSRVAGWFSWLALLGNPVPSQLRSCVENLTHWEHAKYVAGETCHLPEPVLRHAYSAACKVVHGDDVRVPSCFAAGRNFVRFDRRWVTVAGETYTKDVGAILASLPACSYVSSDGPAVSAEKLARFSQPIDLTGYGYPALSPIWGAKIYGHRLPHRDVSKVPIVLSRREFQVTEFGPKYNRDMPEEEAWSIIEEAFPGLNRNAVKLLVAAKGVAEGETGLPPMIFVSGPTGSAKTGSIQLAAGICGDSVHSVPWSNNVERVRAALLEAKEGGSYAVFNEIVKDARHSGRDLQSALGFLLNLTPDSLSHKLYVGPVQLGSLPVCCLTDTSLPAEIIENGQLARRLTHVGLQSRLDWEDTIRQHSIGRIADFRLADPRFAKAADSILSAVIDDYFRYPMTFEEIAIQLGFSKLEASEAMAEKHEVLKAFFQAVCVAPALDGTDARRWSGRGWKLINRDTQNDLRELWSQLCDESWVHAEKCSETDWGRLLGLPPPVTFESRSHGNSKVAVRFVRKKSHTDYQVNDELGNAVSGSSVVEGTVPGSGSDADGSRSPVGLRDAVFGGSGTVDEKP